MNIFCTLPSFVCLAFTCFNQCFLKEWFYQEIQRGRHTKAVLQEAGFNTDIIATRIRSIRSHILKWKAEQPKMSSRFTSSPAQANVYELAAAHVKIGKLEHELKRARQELEFVKKL